MKISKHLNESMNSLENNQLWYVQLGRINTDVENIPIEA